ncbi:MAG TPA: TIGR03435 family protein [Vicinamibacterales bacterium]|nr:TIGR03435 family protein [Vicinamibacterales bacterium]
MTLRNMHLAMTFAVASALTLPVLAQQAPTSTEARPSFEVASVRANTSGSNQVSMGMQPGGRFTAVNIPLTTLIRSAYRLQDSQLVDAPDWIETQRYDITAKAERDLPPPSPFGPPSTGMLMLQSLLEERFTLKVHREVREQPIYALVTAHTPAKLGPNLRKSDIDCAVPAAMRKSASAQMFEKPVPECGMHMGFGEILGGARTMGLLSNALAQTVQRSVMDRTALNGNYDFHLKWTPDIVRQRASGAPGETVRVNGIDFDPTGPSIFTAVQEQLGLKLDATRGPVDVLVVDHVERPAPD